MFAAGRLTLLGYMGPESRVAIPDLARALRADHEWIRNAAGRTLATIDPLPNATQAEIEGLIDMYMRTAPEPDEDERGGRENFGSLGPGAAQRGPGDPYTSR